jgi:hypothetical protein
MYTTNHIKTNTDFDFYVRQYTGRHKSLEFYYHYAPEQYIRELSDIPPFAGVGETDYENFRFTRNIANITWRHRVANPFRYKLIVETNRRYYNQPFIENDIEAWEIRGQVELRPIRALRFYLDYSYEYAWGRGIDTVGETIETSDDSDPSYARDLYRFEVSYYPRYLRKLLEEIEFVFLFMDYYYTSSKDLFADPYHVGRRDMITKISLALKQRIGRHVDVSLTGRYSVRTVDSPYYGDVSLDKEYDQRRVWLGVGYSF